MGEKQISQEELNEVKNYFHYVKFVGKGAYGKVVHALDKTTNEDLAVKIVPNKGFDPEYYAKIKKEWKILKKMNHQNIVQFKGVIETKNYILILMEYIKGGSLGQLIKKHRLKNKKFTDQQAAQIMRNILRGVAYLHENDVVHRDLKPDNILLGETDNFETVKLADLGLAEKFVYGSQVKLLTKQKGTLIYMAPEQISNQVYSKEIDIFSCGIIMYTLLAGYHPIYVKGDTEKSYVKKLNQLK